MTEYEFKKDKLVLYFEEDSELDQEEDGFSELRCYIMYDQYEKEYFITGKKQDDSSEDFRFYCKSIKDTYIFLTHIVDSCSKINLSLLNFSNIPNDDDNNENYYSLEGYSENEGTEIVTFCDCVDSASRTTYDSTNHLYIFLKMLKKVRY